MLDNQEFIEYNEYNNNLYGTSYAELERCSQDTVYFKKIIFDLDMYIRT
jgi:guanylate kinase